MTIAVDKLINEAHLVLEHAYAPYSQFKVAVSLLAGNGCIYTGVNVENASYPCSTCAENSAIAKMVSAGQQEIKAVVILASNQKACPPCGACRQMIYEFSTDKTKIFLCDSQKILEEFTVYELLPNAFQFKKHLK